MTAVLAAFSLQHEIEHYGAYAGIAAVFGLGILSLLYFAQAREVKRLREWAGRAPERAAELEARVTADAQRRVAPPVPAVARPTAPATPAAQQSAAPPVPGIAAPATAAAAAAGAPATTVAKPGTTAPQNGTGSGAAVPPPGTEDKPEEAKPQDGAAKKPEEAGATPAADEPKPFGPQPKPAEPEAKPAEPEAKPAEPDAKPPVPAATAAAGAPATPAPPPAAAPTPTPRPSAPLRAPVPSASLPPRTPAGARARADADGGRSRGRVAAIVGGVLGVVAVLAVAGILIFGGGGDEPTPPPNTVAQPTTADADTPNGSATPKAPAKVNRKSVPLAVLNGTTVTGLARGAADKLTTKGYNEPNVVTNDTTNQARPTTQIYYEAKVRAAALDVAKILGVPTAQVKPMDANARALADRAEVAVFVGADKAQ
jgi:hypothetical protein